MHSLFDYQDVDLNDFRTEKLVDLEKVFSARLSSNKSLVLFEEECDQFYNTVLDKTLLQTLIASLQDMADQMVPLPSLTRESRVGELASWKTIGGELHIGKLKEWDSNVAIMKMADRSEKAVEC